MLWQGFGCFWKFPQYWWMTDVLVEMQLIADPVEIQLIADPVEMLLGCN